MVHSILSMLLLCHNMLSIFEEIVSKREDRNLKIDILLKKKIVCVVLKYKQVPICFFCLLGSQSLNQCNVEDGV